DIDNNKYPTVFINGQEWMAEGLRTTKYNDGTSILLIENLHDWLQDSIGVYAHYDNISARSVRAGAFYNWQAVNSGKLCPQGWRVPTAQDFSALSDYLGGNAVAGGALKRNNTSMWNAPNRDATNETGFSAVGGGIVYHEIIGNFGSRGVISVMWSSTEHDADRAYYRLLHFNDGHFVSKRGKKTHGMCVRCVRDE
ncbi:MAG: fibrobacter succinogenes major paralogous domain-containing protein, partial [Cryomorphaceae bacterium]|nr:fibrobacter succinogenes major paralogous domain-containing protein [Cryomorphaceae bacterium]